MIPLNIKKKKIILNNFTKNNIHSYIKINLTGTFVFNLLFIFDNDIDFLGDNLCFLLPCVIGFDILRLYDNDNDDMTIYFKLQRITF